MSAAANAAGYLYAHGYLPTSDVNTRVDVASSHHTAVLWQGQSQPLEKVRTPRIEYRKRRSYALPSAA
jgi:hypothetical protein